MKTSISSFLVLSLLFFAVVIEANLLPVVDKTTVCSSKSPCELKWVEDGTLPKLAELPLVNIKLMTGPNDNQIEVLGLGTVSPAVSKIVYNIPPDLGPPGRNYFYEFNAGVIDVRSSRFTINDIEGVIEGFNP